MESVSEKDRLVQEALLGALHEQEPRALLDQKGIQDREVCQGRQRTLAAQDTRDLKDIQAPEAIQDQLAHKVIQDRKASREIQDGLGNKDRRDCQVHKVKPDTQGQ